MELVDWSIYNSQYSTMKQVFDATGVTYLAKVTHDRVHAIQGGGFGGLAPYQLHAITKHQQDKFSKAYQSEGEREVR
jgi:hypothetical protein